MEIAIGVLIGLVVVALFFAIRVSVLSRRSAAPHLAAPPTASAGPVGAVAGTPVATMQSMLVDMADELADIADSATGSFQVTHKEQVIVGPDGTRYTPIDEITDPDLRDRVQKALDRLGRLQWPET